MPWLAGGPSCYAASSGLRAQAGTPEQLSTPMPTLSSDPLLTVAVVTFNSIHDLPACLDSLREGGTGRVRTVVVDNASTDGTAELVRHGYPAVELEENRVNRGYGAALNQVLRTTRTPYLLLTNADVVYRPGSVARLVETLQREPRVGLIGPMLEGDDGVPVSPARAFPSVTLELAELFLAHRLWPRNPVHHGFFQPGRPGYVVGAVLVARTRALEEVGGFDERYWLYFEETDLAWRLARAGWDVAVCPEATVVHHGGGSARHVDAESLELAMLASQRRFFFKTGGFAAVASLWLVQLAGNLFRALVWSSRRLLTPGRSRHLAEPLARAIRQIRWLLWMSAAPPGVSSAGARPANLR
ncbi:MAG: glycosyltransferase family 2 protein [Candidatus Riflebacteria bacterium]|nr:glycosyltransferase family 2 protein [Candidatus Riflebacteria bacterium]